jgi:hypothetical protein
MFLGLPDPDPLVRGTDPDLVPSVVKKKIWKNLDSYCFVTSLWLLSLKNDVNDKCSLKKNLEKYYF